MNHLSSAQRIGRWSVFAGYCALIVYLSDQPGDSGYIAPFEHIDKIAHLFEYAVFAILLLLALPTMNRNRQVALAITAAVLFAISDEVHQSFVPYRDASVGDVVADLLGACAGALLLLLGVRARRSRKVRAATCD